MTPQPQLHFRHIPTGKEVESVWTELRDLGIWRDARFHQHEANTFAGASNRSGWSPVLAEWFPIFAGQTWCDKTGAAVDKLHVPTVIPEGIESFLQATYAFFTRFEDRKIGVQLSGGLDSSLIIGLLRHFGINHALVGLQSHRYEFRTERRVQELLADQSSEVELIDGATCLPCAHLEQVPTHQVPDLLSLNFAQDEAMAQACNQCGIEVLLSGGGGDNLLGQSVPVDSLSCEWRPQTFTDPFPVDIVYLRRGIRFTSFFGDTGVVDALYNLRRGQNNDYRKLWARHYFRDFLPREVVEYTYCADFWGRDIEGLVNALTAIRVLHQSARDFTGNCYFDEANLEELLAEDFYRPRKKLHQQIEARISSAVWVCSLAKWLEVESSTVVSPMSATTEIAEHLPN